MKIICEMKKTIEKAARESSIKAGYQPKIAADVIGQTVYECGFIAGAEFAQRWISVEDELPENSDNDRDFLVKQSNGRIFLARNFRNNRFWSLSFTEIKDITHWRLIELK
jgi:hypothetical protein